MALMAASVCRAGSAGMMHFSFPTKIHFFPTKCTLFPDPSIIFPDPLLCRGEIRNSVTRCAKGKLMN